MKTTQNILIIGATGGTGIELIRQLSKHPSKPKVHALVRDPSKLSSDDTKLCASVLTGDALQKADLTRALADSKADVVVVSIGNGPKNVSQTELRTKSAQALVEALQGFPQTKVLCISSIGANDSRIKAGWGMGLMIEWYLQHILKDHTGQEKALLTAMPDRVTVVRPTGLTENKPTGHVESFGSLAQPPTVETDRADLAAWIVQQICDEKSVGGKVVNITSVVKK